MKLRCYGGPADGRWIEVSDGARSVRVCAREGGQLVQHVYVRDGDILLYVDAHELLGDANRKEN